MQVAEDPEIGDAALIEAKMRAAGPLDVPPRGGKAEQRTLMHAMEAHARHHLLTLPDQIDDVAMIVRQRRMDLVHIAGESRVATKFRPERAAEREILMKEIGEPRQLVPVPH